MELRPRPREPDIGSGELAAASREPRPALCEIPSAGHAPPYAPGETPIHLAETRFDLREIAVANPANATADQEIAMHRPEIAANGQEMTTDGQEIAAKPSEITHLSREIANSSRAHAGATREIASKPFGMSAKPPFTGICDSSNTAATKT